MTRVLVARLGRMGDRPVSGPAVRAIAPRDAIDHADLSGRQAVARYSCPGAASADDLAWTGEG